MLFSKKSRFIFSQIVPYNMIKLKPQYFCHIDSILDMGFTGDSIQIQELALSNKFLWQHTIHMLTLR